MGQSSCLQLGNILHNCLPVGESRVTDILWNLLVVVNIMFAGHFFLTMFDDYLKKKKWLKYRTLKTEDDETSRDLS
jgi:hypothetical protein